MKKTLVSHICVLFGLPVLGLLLLLLVHLIPVERMQKNVMWSLEMIESEFTDELVIDGYRPTLTGNFTDSLMLEHAIYKRNNHTILNQVLLMNRPESFYDPEDLEGWQPGESLRDYLNGVKQPREAQYARYWHGYLIVLKPLLYCMTVNSIRMVNSIVELFLFGLILVLMGKKKQNQLAFAFAASVPFLFFTVTFASLSQSICLYLMLIATIIILWKSELLVNLKRICMFFLIFGMLTSYFDFLTYPLIVLAYPLCVVLSLYKGKTAEKIKRMLLCSFEWGVGYAWMWGTKWIFTDIFTDSSTIKDAISTVAIRTGDASDSNRITGAIKVISLNIKPFANMGFVALAAIVIVVLLIMLKKEKPVKIRISNVIPFLLLFLYPFAWWIALENHSEQHWVFTCRIFSAAILALLMGVQSIFEHNDMEC